MFLGPPRHNGSTLDIQWHGRCLSSSMSDLHEALWWYLLDSFLQLRKFADWNTWIDVRWHTCITCTWWFWGSRYEYKQHRIDQDNRSRWKQITNKNDQFALVCYKFHSQWIFSENFIASCNVAIKLTQQFGCVQPMHDLVGFSDNKSYVTRIVPQANSSNTLALPFKNNP